jgi:hypothetical protein
LLVSIFGDCPRIGHGPGWLVSIYKLRGAFPSCYRLPIRTFKMNHFDTTHGSSDEDSKPIPACTGKCTSDIHNDPLPTPPKVVPNCPLSADIVLVSSDGHRFGTHCKNLGDFTGGFPLEISPANGEDVPMLDLNAEALSLFLQYIHHHRQPDLSTVAFRSLSQLAEAVEKYDVYSATEICRVQMR